MAKKKNARNYISTPKEVEIINSGFRNTVERKSSKVKVEIVDFERNRYKKSEYRLKGCFSPFHFKLKQPITGCFPRLYDNTDSIKGRILHQGFNKNGEMIYKVGINKEIE